MKQFFSLVFTLCTFYLMGQRHSLIPIPQSYQSTDELLKSDGNFMLDDKSGSKEVAAVVAIFKEKADEAGFSIGSDISGKKLEISIISGMNGGVEAYELHVKNEGLVLKAGGTGGVHNGLQTVLQLLRHADKIGTSYAIEGAIIKDNPRFEWRGLMLDVSRHFFTKEEVLSYIDKMSEYKFNVFHWHLTDDEGWRIEIKSMPKLTEVGAWRVERDGKFGARRPYPQPGEKATYGGFYTHEDIKEVVAYAAARNITIVPEIDVPGHSMALLAAYPELSTKKEPKFVNPGSKFAEWYGNGTFEMLIENTVNPADEKVYEAMDKIMTEVAMLFPGKFIHMGGDECYKGFWEKDKNVQAFMKKNKIPDVHHLQAYFVERMQKIVSAKGKELIGWDEILEGHLAEGAAVMSWRGMKGGIEAAKKGHKVVMSPTTYAYIDYTQGDASVENPIYASLSLKKTYEFEPVPDEVDPKFILGGQANLWTEMVSTLPFAMYMTYPRALSISETMWSSADAKDWTSFTNRLEAHFNDFDKEGVAISKAVYDPIIHTYMLGDKMMLSLSSDIPGAEIRYTLDNTYPAEIMGKVYTGPVVVPDGDLRLHVQVIKDGKAVGRALVIHRDDLAKRVRKA
ncbi:MAG: family 20 glycosylhydrolase [Saprospiraceae bacterium]|nr:family 20 glycosylhydrolase [Saprospiraceae bacterium]